MKSENLIEVLTTATEALRTMKPLLKMPGAEKGKEFQEPGPRDRGPQARDAPSLWRPLVAGTTPRYVSVASGKTEARSSLR